MMKKLMSLALVAVLLLSMCVTAILSVSAAGDTLYIFMGDKVYSAKVGDVITYKIDLYAEREFEDIQAGVNYDNQKLRPLLYSSFDPSVLPWHNSYGEYESEEHMPNLTNVVLNLRNCIRFSGVNIQGYDFSTEKTLLDVQMLVTNPGYTDLQLKVEGMTILGGEESYFDYFHGDPIVTEGISITESLNIKPLESAPNKSEIDNQNLVDNRDLFTVYFYAGQFFEGEVGAYSYDYETSEEYLGEFKDRGSLANDEGNGYYSIDVPEGTDFVVFSEKKSKYYYQTSNVSDLIHLNDRTVLAIPDGTVTKDTGMMVYGVSVSETEELPSIAPDVPVVTEPVVSTEPLKPTEAVTYPDYDGNEDTQYVTLNDGNRYAFQVGDTFTYTVRLKADELFEDIQSRLRFNPDMLKLNRVSTDPEEEGFAYAPNLGGSLVLNARNNGIVSYNSIKLRGFDFREEKALLTLSFTVISGGESNINHVIQEMNIRGGFEAYFEHSLPSKTEGITLGYSVSDGTQVNPTVPTTTQAVEETKPVYVPDDILPTDPTEPRPTPGDGNITAPTDAPDWNPDSGRPGSPLPGSPAPGATEPVVTEPLCTEPLMPPTADDVLPTEAEPGVSDRPAIPETTAAAELTDTLETVPQPEGDPTSATEGEKAPVDAPNTGSKSYVLFSLIALSAVGLSVVMFNKRRAK